MGSSVDRSKARTHETFLPEWTINFSSAVQPKRLETPAKPARKVEAAKVMISHFPPLTGAAKREATTPGRQAIPSHFPRLHDGEAKPGKGPPQGKKGKPSK
jgi:hypothetical protein